MAFDYRTRTDDPPIVMIERNWEGCVRIVPVAERFSDVFPAMVDEGAAEALHRAWKAGP